MIKAIFLTLAIIFAVLGLCDVIYAVKSALLFPDTKTRSYLVFNLKKGYGLQQLRYFSQKKRWYGSEFCDKIVALNDDLDFVENSSCENYIAPDDVVVCDTNRLRELLNDFEHGDINGRKDL